LLIIFSPDQAGKSFVGGFSPYESFPTKKMLQKKTKFKGGNPKLPPPKKPLGFSDPDRPIAMNSTLHWGSTHRLANIFHTPDVL